MARKLSLDLETENLEPTESKTETLEQTELKEKKLNHDLVNHDLPNQTELTDEQLEQTEFKAITPIQTKLTTPVPDMRKKENIVVIDGIEVEIKPTKYRYFRNKFTIYYKYMKDIPISDLLTLGEGAFGREDKRSGDQVVFDFLCAVFDDPYFVQDHYDNMDPELMEQILEIYGRVNHIKDKEENVKNRQAQTTA